MINRKMQITLREQFSAWTLNHSLPERWGWYAEKTYFYWKSVIGPALGVHYLIEPSQLGNYPICTWRSGGNRVHPGNVEKWHPGLPSIKPLDQSAPHRCSQTETHVRKRQLSRSHTWTALTEQDLMKNRPTERSFQSSWLLQRGEKICHDITAWWANGSFS